MMFLTVDVVSMETICIALRIRFFWANWTYFNESKFEIFGIFVAFCSSGKLTWCASG